MGESMSGGREALDARDRGVAEIAALIDEAQVGPPTSAVDLDYSIRLGGAIRMIATRLRRGESTISSLGDELSRGWRVPAAGRDRWHDDSRPGAAASPHVPDVPIQEMPSVSRRAAPGLGGGDRGKPPPADPVRGRPDGREKGYTATTVADITKLARVDGHASTGSSPTSRRRSSRCTSWAPAGDGRDLESVLRRRALAERSWQAGRALTQLLQDNPLVAKVGFVEAYSVGSAAVQRIEESYRAFMFFLQEGLLYRPRAIPPSRVAMEVIVTSVFEVDLLAGTARRTARDPGPSRYRAPVADAVPRRYGCGRIHLAQAPSRPACSTDLCKETTGVRQ